MKNSRRSSSLKSLDDGRRVIHSQCDLFHLINQTDFEREILILDTSVLLSRQISQAQAGPLVLAPHEQLSAGIDGGIGVHTRVDGSYVRLMKGKKFGSNPLPEKGSEFVMIDLPPLD